MTPMKTANAFMLPFANVYAEIHIGRRQKELWTEKRKLKRIKSDVEKYFSLTR